MYLLKFENKEDNTAGITVKLVNKYKEFDTIEEIIDFLFNNAIYIKRYKIFKLVHFEEQKSATISCGNGIKVDSAYRSGNVTIQA